MPNISRRPTGLMPQQTLTRYASGSIAEIWIVSYPLMLTALSTSLMLFFDRLILANYSTEAMNAAVTAGAVCAVFQFSAFALAAISEVFVGQLNGAKETHRLGEPVWQMIWFSVLSILIFWPLALYSGHLFIPDQYEQMGLPYFQWLMLFGPVSPFIAALSGFFIGQGKTRLIASAAILGNITNLTLDIILIFGIKNWVPSMGIKGAAIATCIGMTSQALLLFVVFMNKKHRQFFGTLRYHFQFGLFYNSLKISVPNALSHKIELVAWALIFNLMASLGSEHVTVVAIAQSVFILFAFLTEGLSVGTTSLVANSLGAKQPYLIGQTFFAGLKLHSIFLLILTLPLIIYPNLVIDAFVANPSNELFRYIQMALLSIWLFFLFDGIVWILAGILTAAADTKYILMMSTLNVCFGLLLPAYLFIVLLKFDPATIWKIMPVYSALHCLSYYWRYKSGAWRKKVIHITPQH